MRGTRGRAPARYDVGRGGGVRGPVGNRRRRWGRELGEFPFAVDDAAIFQCGDEMDVRERGREDAASNGEDFAAFADGFGEVSSDVGEGGKKEIAEIVANETAAGFETILKEAAEESFIFGKGDHAVADVARGEDAVFAAEAAGGATVVGDGDDGDQVGDGAFGGGMVVAAADAVFFEAAEEGGEAGTAAESDDAEAAAEDFRWGGFFSHEAL